MAAMAAIRDAVKDTLEAAIPQLHVYDTVPDAPNLPAVIVQPVTCSFADEFIQRGMDVWEFDLIVLVSARDMGLAQDDLDAFVTGSGDESIRRVIRGARSLGLSGTQAHVDRLDSYGARFESAQVEHVGAVLRLVVRTQPYI